LADAARGLGTNPLWIQRDDCVCIYLPLLEFFDFNSASAGQIKSVRVGFYLIMCGLIT
jgi:hypothetical protein